MKSIVTSIALMSVFAVSNAQTTATNWTATDCSSASHTLFTELNAGKVIVFIWVMPCASCVNGAKAVSTAVQGFATSNPGKVLAYLSDDMGDQTCSDISTWMTSNSVGTNFTVFGNAGNTINEANYGGSGMPHVVVMGGTDHKVYYNQKGSAVTASAITSAVNSALASTGVSTVSSQIAFTLSPNPVTERLTINYSKPVESVIITSLDGQVVKEEVYASGKTNPTINLSGIANGVYMLKVIDMDGKVGAHKIVKE